MLSPSEKAEVLQLLAQLEQVAEAEAFEDPRHPMGDYLMEFGGAQPVAGPVSWPPGERPDIATFIASFAPALPPAPPKSTPATVSSVPDAPLRVPPGRRGKLLDDVLTRTQEEMRRGAQSDEDRLHLYRGVGRLHIDSGFTDE
jgi:hypothetical protein